MNFSVVKYKGSAKLAVVKEGQVVAKTAEGWLVKPSKSGKVYSTTLVRDSFLSQKAASDFAKDYAQEQTSTAAIESTSGPSEFTVITFELVITCI